MLYKEEASRRIHKTMMLKVAIGLVLLSSTVLACGSGASDSEYIQDPVFQMLLSPPVGWTYFPSAPSTANQAIWYFVGQSNDTLTAKSRADTEIQAAMIEAINAASLPSTSVTVTNDYQPVEVENPMGNPQAGATYGKVEGGALIATATAAQGATVLEYTPYTVQLRVSVKNLGTTRFYWSIVQNTFLQKMSMNYHARFTGDVTVNKV
ncbi:unnamed protein product [Caenorhabditis bovis]|uniref:DUF1795 domain-containing protein n=1 Tax=Caenorhabditis bovis TaxID=2654633 RepID=A0A8S1EW47_9PELO|nr:unnamed protein product [Caenorhabditis bovis]